MHEGEGGFGECWWVKKDVETPDGRYSKQSINVKKYSRGSCKLSHSNKGTAAVQGQESQSLAFHLEVVPPG